MNECSYRREAGHIADDDFFLRVGAFTNVVGISRPLAGYRHHSESTTSKEDALSLRLAKDFTFQSRIHTSEGSLLENDDRKKLYALAVKLINRSLLTGVKKKEKQWIAETFRLREELESLAPGIFSQTPVWARPMWELAALPGS